MPRGRGARLRSEEARRTEQRLHLPLLLCEPRPAQARVDRRPVARDRPRDRDADLLVRTDASAVAGALRRDLRRASVDPGAPARQIRERRARVAAVLPDDDDAARSEPTD